MSSTGAQPTVYVLEDDQDVQSTLVKMLSSVGIGVEAFRTVGEFLERYDPEEPGCLVLDMRLPDRSGLDLLEQLRDQSQPVTAILITAHGDAASAVRAMKAGVFDFIEKPFNSQLLLGRIQQAIAADAENRRARRHRDELRERLATLRPRETEVLRLVIEGYSTKQIAHALKITQKTAENYRANILEKMGAVNTAELVRLVMIAQDDGPP